MTVAEDKCKCVHTPIPWMIGAYEGDHGRLTIEQAREDATGKYTPVAAVLQLYTDTGGIHGVADANARFIIEACNNYERMKSQIARLEQELTDSRMESEQFTDLLNDAREELERTQHQRYGLQQRLEQAEHERDSLKAVPLREGVPAHDDPKDCPTWYDWCNCTVDTLRHNIERSEKAEKKLEQARAEKDDWQKRAGEALEAVHSLRGEIQNYLDRPGTENYARLERILAALTAPKPEGGTEEAGK